MREPNLTELSLNEIELEKKTEVRPLRPNIVKQYAADMKAGALFPAITVFNPEGSERYIIADGRHRVAAAEMAGLETIAVDLHEGGVREALEYALGSNHDHGLQRNDADRRRVIEIACKDAEWSQWSHRQIADLVRISDKTVAKIRQQIGWKKPDKIKTKQTTKDGEPVKQKAEKKKKPKKQDKGANPSAPSADGADKGNRRDLLQAIALIKAMPFDGGEAVERLKLEALRDDLEYCRDWFAEALKQ